MGEVLLCHDLELHRDVALKIMREHAAGDTHLVARFENEVRVQGQLDHPAIVPVYECGRTSDGFTWFTMKHVQGKSLAQVLARLRQHDPGSAALYGSRRILSAFATVCLAVAFAHARRIIHRDIKPSNVMLGDYGEVYLLDWGIARLPDGVDDAAGAQLPHGAALTLAGDIVGTLGYMAPEQVRGMDVDFRADIYALGAVLFEILTLERLHDGESNIIIAATLKGADARASKRTPDRSIPIELEELCIRATAMNPEERPSAKEMHDRVQAFLDGQRDLEERQRQSRLHYTRALEAYAARREAGPAAREETLRELSRALALDDSNEDARALLHELVAGPRSEDDEVIVAALTTSVHGLRGMLSRLGAALFATWMLMVVGAASLGVRKWEDIATVFVLTAVCAVMMFLHVKRQTGLSAWAVLLTAEFAAAMTATASGAFILLPVILSFIGVAFTAGATNAKLVDRNDWLLRALPVGAPLTTALTFLVTAVLELQDVAFSPIRFSGDEVVITARSIAFPPVYTPIFLLITHTILIVGPAVLVLQARALTTRLETRALAEVAHLRPLVPGSSSDLVEIVEKADPQKS